jgi:hypothetical protein
MLDATQGAATPIRRSFMSACEARLKPTVRPVISGMPAMPE